MNQEKKVRNRVIAAVLIVFGLMLATTWWDSDATKCLIRHDSGE